MIEASKSNFPDQKSFIVTTGLEEFDGGSDSYDTVLTIRVQRFINRTSIDRTVMRSFWLTVALPIADAPLTFNIQGKGITVAQKGQLEISIPTDQEQYTEKRIRLRVNDRDHLHPIRTLDIQFFHKDVFLGSVTPYINIYPSPRFANSEIGCHG